MLGLAHELKPPGIGVLLLHPGWMRTRTDSSSAPVGPEESVRGMRALAVDYEPRLTGGFLGFEEVTGAVHFV